MFFSRGERDHIIRDEKDYRNHLAYIYHNAIKHGYVQEPEQWKWMWIEGMERPH
jgi:putative transposase